MESDILGLMKKPFPIVVAAGIGAQLVLTIVMIRYSQSSMHPPAMDATEPEIMFRTLLKQHPAQAQRTSTAKLNRESSIMEEGGGTRLPFLPYR